MVRGGNVIIIGQQRANSNLASMRTVSHSGGDVANDSKVALLLGGIGSGVVGTTIGERDLEQNAGTKSEKEGHPDTLVNLPTLLEAGAMNAEAAAIRQARKRTARILTIRFEDCYGECAMG